MPRHLLSLGAEAFSVAVGLIVLSVAVHAIGSTLVLVAGVVGVVMMIKAAT